MFIPAVIAADGRPALVATGTPNAYNGGIAYVNLAVRVSTASPSGTDVFHNGLRFTQEGYLMVVDGVGSGWSQGFAVDSSGRIAVNSGTVSGEVVSNGVALDDTGRMFVTGLSGGEPETFRILTEGGDTLATEGGDTLNQEN